MSSQIKEPGSILPAASGSCGKTCLTLLESCILINPLLLSTSQRPERLISKLKTMNNEEAARGAPRIVVIRQPKGPDGTKGFGPRGAKEKSPVVVMDLMEQLTAQ